LQLRGSECSSRDSTGSISTEARRGLTQSQLEAMQKQRGAAQSLRRANVGDAEPPEVDAKLREVDAGPERLMLGQRG